MGTGRSSGWLHWCMAVPLCTKHDVFVAGFAYMDRWTRFHITVHGLCSDRRDKDQFAAVGSYGAASAAVAAVRGSDGHDEDIARGYREVAETNCEASVYAMPEGITPSFNWHKRGTFGEWARLDLGGFAFPLGTNDEAVTTFSVFNDGRMRPTPRDAAREICAVGVPMLALQGASRFWVADVARPEAAPYQSKLLTWENFFLNADTNTPVNAQIELFQNGDFTTRSNALERIYRRVAYFDWDGDGLENTVDPDPLVAGADAHGTNAEWYNVVCSNVLEAVAGDGGVSGTPCPTLSWLEGVNSNAYYFVDVVATNGPAPIYFTGDRESRLGNPVVVALAGVTNRVPLLIGIDYAITSPVPFTVRRHVRSMAQSRWTGMRMTASLIIESSKGVMK